MNSKYLFNHKYKKWGWLVFIPTAIASFIVVALEISPSWLDTKVFAIAVDQIFEGSKSFSFVNNNILNEILGVLLIISGVLLAFSKEKDEDEYIAQIRLSSLVWATYVNYAVLLLAFLFVYDLSFLWVMIFNMFTILVFFIIRFNFKLYQLKKAASHD